MSFPAARLGDQTVHGGTIGPVTTGVAARVMIGNKPAACMGDMQICPMFDGPKPHVGGMILMGSPTVFIGGKMAARVNDPHECKGPPGTIAVGEFTVLIGNAGGGGAGAGAPGTPAASMKAAAENGSALVCKGPCEACGAL